MEGDGGIAAAAALVIVALDVTGGRAAALAVRVIGPGAAAPVAVGVLGAGAVAELAVALVLVGAGEAGAVPLRGEDELAAQAGAQPGAAPVPCAARGAHAHGGVCGVRHACHWVPSEPDTSSTRILLSPLQCGVPCPLVRPSVWGLREAGC